MIRHKWLVETETQVHHPAWGLTNTWVSYEEYYAHNHTKALQHVVEQTRRLPVGDRIVLRRLR